MIDLVMSATAPKLQERLKQRFRSVPKEKRHTYTYDNGREIGFEDASLEKKIGMDVYRAYPYHSWERGCNENYNGLVRDFFPKKTDFATLKPSDVKRVERILNHRPRKRLGYLTPHEVFVLGRSVGGAVQG
jgi:transposase, IS30 family